MMLCNGKICSENGIGASATSINPEVPFGCVLAEAMITPVVAEECNCNKGDKESGEGSDKSNVTFGEIDLSDENSALVSSDNYIVATLALNNDQVLISNQNANLSALSKNGNKTDGERSLSSVLQIGSKESKVFERSMPSMGAKSSESVRQLETNSRVNAELESNSRVNAEFDNSNLIAKDSQINGENKTFFEFNLDSENKSKFNIDYNAFKESNVDFKSNVVKPQVNFENPEKVVSVKHNEMDLKNGIEQNKNLQKELDFKLKAVVQGIKSEPKEKDLLNSEQFNIRQGKVFTNQALEPEMVESSSTESVFMKENIAAIETAIRAEAKKGVDTEFTLKLKPEGLGEVTVELKNVGEQLEVVIKAKLSSTGELIAGEAKNLHASLNSDNSAQFSRVSVAVEYGFGEAGNSMTERHHGDTYRNDSFSMGTDFESISEETEPVNRIRNKMRTGLIDYMA